MAGLIEHLVAGAAWLALVVGFALRALESSAFLGFISPGLVASHGHVSLAAVMAAGVGGAVVGDAVGYLMGRRWADGSWTPRWVASSRPSIWIAPKARCPGAAAGRSSWAGSPLHCA